MPRNHYETAFGVCRVEWKTGEPTPSHFPVLVEVWRPSLVSTDPTWNVPTRPAIRIQATIEVRVYFDNSWKVVGYKGALETPRAGEVRRWARFVGRRWDKTITLDGWGS